MSSLYASGKHALGMCDICGTRCEYTRLKEVFRAGLATGLMACPQCWDKDHPQLWLGRIKVNDPQALRNARPDTGKDSSRALFDRVKTIAAPVQVLASPVTVVDDGPYPYHDGIIYDATLLTASGGKVMTRVPGQPVQGGPLTSMFTFSRASTGTYRAASGLLVSASSGSPRIDYDSTGQIRGLLMESTRTNLILRSNEFSNAAWAKSGASTSADIVAGPDGTTTADRLIEDAAPGEHRMRQTLTVSAGATVTTSVFAKAGERNFINVRALDGSSVGDIGAAWFNLTTGTIGTTNILGAATLYNATIEPYANGFYRCSVTVKPNATMTSCIVDLFLASADGVVNYVGDGTSGAYFAGAQFEEGRPVSSYIPTTTASVLRAPDRAFHTLGGEFDITKGTMFTQYTMRLHLKTGANQFIANFSDNTPSSNSITLFNAVNGTTRMSMNSDAGFAGLALMATVATDMVEHKIAGAYQVNDLTVVRDGAVGTPDTTAPLCSLSTRLDFGNSADGTQVCEVVWLKYFDYWPERKTNAELQVLTT